MARNLKLGDFLIVVQLICRPMMTPDYDSCGEKIYLASCFQLSHRQEAQDSRGGPRGESQEPRYSYKVHAPHFSFMRLIFVIFHWKLLWSTYNILDPRESKVQENPGPGILQSSISLTPDISRAVAYIPNSTSAYIGV